MRLVLFNLMVMMTIAGDVVSLFMCISGVMPRTQVPLLLIALPIVLVPFYLANNKGRLAAASNFLVIAGCFILFPLLYFYQGGIKSGMGSWFVLGVLFIFLLLDGINFVLMLGIDAIVIAFCYFISYRHPEMIGYSMDEKSYYIDVVQSIFVTSLAVGLILKIQLMMQRQKNALIDEKNAELVEMTQRAKQAQKEAEIANESKSSFLANMSHEIRTPINTVLGMNEMILRKTKEPDTRELAQDINASTEALLGIVNEILDFSRIESGKMELLPEDYALSSLIHDTVLVFDGRAREKGLTLTVDVDTELPAMLHGDSLRIRQILTNILSNAVKYTRQGGITFSLTGDVEGNEATLHFAVTDTGIGIREEDIEKLFEAFERIDERTNRSIEGTGLGMAITANLLRMMGSSLQVQSVYGEGSTFSFDLVQGVADHMPMGSLAIDRGENHRAERTTFLAPDVKILLVDDNAMNRKVFCKLLGHTKIQIVEADSGYACIEKVRKEHYDIIFLDHMMPELDGVETFMYMQSMQENACRKTPVVILTANAITGAKEQYLQIGFDDYLAKPIDSLRLEQVIIEQLDKQAISVGTISVGELEEGTAYSYKNVEQELPEIEGFDWAYGMLHFPAEDMLFESVEDFYRSGAPALAKLESLEASLEDAKQLDRYRIEVHALKSNLALIGQTQLSALAKTLEYAARDGLLARIRAIHPIFVEEMRTCLSLLAPYFTEEEARELMVDTNWICGVLAMAEQAADAFDYDGVDRAVQMLAEYRYEDALADEITGVQQAASLLDLEGVLLHSKACKEILATMHEA